MDQEVLPAAPGAAIAFAVPPPGSGPLIPVAKGGVNTALPTVVPKAALYHVFSAMASAKAGVAAIVANTRIATLSIFKDLGFIFLSYRGALTHPIKTLAVPVIHL